MAGDEQEALDSQNKPLTWKEYGTTFAWEHKPEPLPPMLQPSPEIIELQRQYNASINSRLDSIIPIKVRLTIWQRFRLWLDKIRAK